MGAQVTAPMTAKLFKNGMSQAVRLPKQFRFEGDEVYIRRNEDGDIVLSKKPLTWAGFFELQDKLFAEGLNIDDFMMDRDLDPTIEKDLF